MAMSVTLPLPGALRLHLVFDLADHTRGWASQLGLFTLWEMIMDIGPVSLRLKPIRKTDNEQIRVQRHQKCHL